MAAILSRPQGANTRNIPIFCMLWVSLFEYDSDQRDGILNDLKSNNLRKYVNIVCAGDLARLEAKTSVVTLLT